MNIVRNNKINKEELPLIERITNSMNELHEKKYIIQKCTTPAIFRHNIRKETPREAQKRLRALLQFKVTFVEY